MSKTLSLGSVSTKLRWITEQSRKHPARVFTSISHLIDEEWMREAYRLTRKTGATGVDNVTAESFAMNLERNLKRLVDEFKSGSYRAKPRPPRGNPKSRRQNRSIGDSYVFRQGLATGSDDARGGSL